MQSGIVIFLAPSAWFGYLAAFLCLSGTLENTGASQKTAKNPEVP
jgi:hypothetical protein